MCPSGCKGSLASEDMRRRHITHDHVRQVDLQFRSCPRPRCNFMNDCYVGISVHDLHEHGPKCQNCKWMFEEFFQLFAHRKGTHKDGVCPAKAAEAGAAAPANAESTGTAATSQDGLFVDGKPEIAGVTLLAAHVPVKRIALVPTTLATVTGIKRKNNSFGDDVDEDQPAITPNSDPRETANVTAKKHRRHSDDTDLNGQQPASSPDSPLRGTATVTATKRKRQSDDDDDHDDGYVQHLVYNPDSDLPKIAKRRKMAATKPKVPQQHGNQLESPLLPTSSDLHAALGAQSQNNRYPPVSPQLLPAAHIPLTSPNGYASAPPQLAPHAYGEATAQLPSRHQDSLWPMDQAAPNVQQGAEQPELQYQSYVPLSPELPAGMPEWPLHQQQQHYGSYPLDIPQNYTGSQTQQLLASIPLPHSVMGQAQQVPAHYSPFPNDLAQYGFTEAHFDPNIIYESSTVAKNRYKAIPFHLADEHFFNADPKILCYGNILHLAQCYSNIEIFRRVNQRRTKNVFSSVQLVNVRIGSGLRWAAKEWHCSVNAVKQWLDGERVKNGVTVRGRGNTSGQENVDAAQAPSVSYDSATPLKRGREDEDAAQDPSGSYESAPPSKRVRTEGSIPSLPIAVEGAEGLEDQLDHERATEEIAGQVRGEKRGREDEDAVQGTSVNDSESAPYFTRVRTEIIMPPRSGGVEELETPEQKLGNEGGKYGTMDQARGKKHGREDGDNVTSVLVDGPESAPPSKRTRTETSLPSPSGEVEGSETLEQWLDNKRAEEVERVDQAKDKKRGREDESTEEGTSVDSETGTPLKRQRLNGSSPPAPNKDDPNGIRGGFFQQLSNPHLQSTPATAAPQDAGPIASQKQDTSGRG